MGGSFDAVDMKLGEADFFLDKLASAGGDVFAAQCYFSAFVSASRSVTFAMQTVMSSSPGFNEWYADRQTELRADPTARFFHDVRTTSIHLGTTPLNAGTMRTTPGGGYTISHLFAPTDGVPIPNMPSEDAVVASTRHITRLAQIVQDCCERFGESIDPVRHYMIEAFLEDGATFEELEVAAGLQPGRTELPGLSGEDRLRLIRRIDPRAPSDLLFEKYLGRARGIA